MRALEQHPDVVAAWVFGSVGRGTARAESDLDVAVLLGDPLHPKPDALPMALVRDLEHAAGRAVDLVLLDHAGANPIHRVLRDGVLVVHRDRSRRIAIEVKKRHEYLDLAPRLRAYRRAQIARSKGPR